MPLILIGPYTQLTPPVQRGFSAPYCRRQTGRWSPTTGWTFDQDFNSIGPSALANMQALANQYAAAGIEYELTLQDGRVTMRTLDTTGNVTIDIWEIAVSQISASRFKNQFNSVMFNLSVGDVGLFLAGVENNTAWASVGPTLADQTDIALLEREYKDFLAGHDSFFYDEYTLRHTTNASNRGYYNVADFNVNKIYTQSQFYSEISNSGYWIFPAPNEIIGALNSIFSGLATAPSNFLQGALKGGSSRVTAANNRVNIVTEYKLFNWSTDEYAYAT